ncbi:hypothetical protein OE699_12830 [Sedimentimonas flavescens]|uniref:Uncharacterized protein n=1 Tax=Sedimentimonas flavescens TaxID=2851012 RepID=A0ABT3A169_9RHOB|nr:hypothetical protein [Sedimentimonas flavescens]MCV2879732.1 hypothetical protein [Sedimentimonas flavescens]
MTLRERILANPAACALLVARAGLSAQKAERALDVTLPEYLGRDAKLHSALDAVEGRAMRQVLGLIEDERDDFVRARMQEAAAADEEAKSLSSFCADVTAQAESVLPGVYFDGVAHG